MLRILQNIALHEDFSNGHQFGSIAYCVEDRPKRFFPEWFSSTIQERKSANDDITEENCKDIAVELANDILGIGSSLSSEAQEELDLAK